MHFGPKTKATSQHEWLEQSTQVRTFIPSIKVNIHRLRNDIS